MPLSGLPPAVDTRVIQRTCLYETELNDLKRAMPRMFQTCCEWVLQQRGYYDGEWRPSPYRWRPKKRNSPRRRRRRTNSMSSISKNGTKYSSSRCSSGTNCIRSSGNSGNSISISKNCNACSKDRNRNNRI